MSVPLKARPALFTVVVGLMTAAHIAGQTNGAITIEIVATGASAYRIIHQLPRRVTRILKGVVDPRIAHGQAIALGARYRIIPVTIKNVFGWVCPLVPRTGNAIGAVGPVVVCYAAGFSGRPV